MKCKTLKKNHICVEKKNKLNALGVSNYIFLEVEPLAFIILKSVIPQCLKMGLKYFFSTLLVHLLGFV